MTALEIANRALLKLKDTAIGSFTDSGAKPKNLRENFKVIADHVLLERDWSFAHIRASLTEDETTTNLTDYEYMYDLPSDMLMPRELSSGEQYIIEGQKLYTNDDDPVLHYTQSVVEMVDSGGTDIPSLTTTVPSYAEEAIALAIAADLALKITGDINTVQLISAEAAATLTRAKQHDAMLSPGNDETPDLWSEV